MYDNLVYTKLHIRNITYSILWLCIYCYQIIAGYIDDFITHAATKLYTYHSKMSHLHMYIRTYICSYSTYYVYERTYKLKCSHLLRSQLRLGAVTRIHRLYAL